MFNGELIYQIGSKVHIHMCVCVRVLGEIGARWRKSKRGGREEDDWNHDKPGSGSCTGFLVHPAAILPAPQIPAVKWEAHLSKVLQI